MDKNFRKWNVFCCFLDGGSFVLCWFQPILASSQFIILLSLNFLMCNFWHCFDIWCQFSKLHELQFISIMLQFTHVNTASVTHHFGIYIDFYSSSDENWQIIILSFIMSCGFHVFHANRRNFKSLRGLVSVVFILLMNTDEPKIQCKSYYRRFPSFTFYKTCDRTVDHLLHLNVNRWTF